MKLTARTDTTFQLHFNHMHLQFFLVPGREILYSQSSEIYEYQSLEI